MSLATAILGHDVDGSGPRHVIVLNDWLCDTSTWDGARLYLDAEQFTFVFADLRGYGRSMAMEGEFCLAEGCEDVLQLANKLGWEKFCLVGHSMSSLIALRFAQLRSERLEALIVLTPPPPRGFGVDQETLEALRAMALASDERRAELLAAQFGDRLAPGWMRYKLARWRAKALPLAAAAYTAMFARDGLPDLSAMVNVPTLAVTGEEDAPHMRAQPVTASLGALCAKLTVSPIATSGHYPMQEAPPLTASIVQKFILAAADSPTLRR